MNSQERRVARAEALARVRRYVEMMSEVEKDCLRMDGGVELRLSDLALIVGRGT